MQFPKANDFLLCTFRVRFKKKVLKSFENEKQILNKISEMNKIPVHHNEQKKYLRRNFPKIKTEEHFFAIYKLKKKS